MASVGTQTLQSNFIRYTLRERIGAGGMATVYRAWDTNLEREVAIKILHEHLSFDSTFQERFEREAKFVAGFHHPHIVQIYDFDVIESDDIPIFYMVMPFLTGATLESMISHYHQRNEVLPQKTTMNVIREIASALDYAHTRGMIHRDVKPANILYDGHNRAILTDFGIARLAELGNLTAEGMAIGTPAYMPPEQAQGLEIGHTADIYSLGIIAYELITGVPPFGEGSISVMLQHVNAPVPQISEHLTIPNQTLDIVISRALAKSPEHRYQTATAFAEELTNALEGNPISNPPQSTTVFDVVTASTQLDSPDSGNRKVKHVGNQDSRSPLGLLAIGLGLLAFVLVIALLSQSSESIPNTIISSISGGVSDVTDSMTGNIYFASTFDETDTMLESWEQSDNLFITREMANDQYRITNHRPNTATTSLFDQSYVYDNIVITMDTHLVDAESSATGYGIVFRYVDPENYYVFAVDGRGRFSIWVRNSGEWIELRNAETTWTEHPTIHTSVKSNSLTLEAYEDTLIGFINGVQVTQVQDDTISEGGIGIYLATTPQGSATIEVDSFTTSESYIRVTAMTDDLDSPTESMTDEE